MCDEYLEGEDNMRAVSDFNKKYFFVIQMDEYGTYVKGSYSTYEEAEKGAARTLKGPNVIAVHIASSVSLIEPKVQPVELNTTTF